MDMVQRITSYNLITSSLSSKVVIVAHQPGYVAELLVNNHIQDHVIRASHFSLLQVLLVIAEILHLLIVERVEGQLFFEILVQFLDLTTKPHLFEMNKLTE